MRSSRRFFAFQNLCRTKPATRIASLMPLQRRQEGTIQQLPRLEAVPEFHPGRQQSSHCRMRVADVAPRLSGSVPASASVRSRSKTTRFLTANFTRDICPASLSWLLRQQARHVGSVQQGAAVLTSLATWLPLGHVHSEPLRTHPSQAKSHPSVSCTCGERHRREPTRR